MAKSSQFNGELIHFGSVRFRVTGVGNLQVYLKSLDEVSTAQLEDIAMAVVTDREPVDLANFISQKAFLELKTTEINEVFNISKIVLFVRPVATGYPQ